MRQAQLGGTLHLGPLVHPAAPTSSLTHLPLVADIAVDHLPQRLRLALQQQPMHNLVDPTQQPQQQQQRRRWRQQQQRPRRRRRRWQRHRNPAPPMAAVAEAAAAEAAVAAAAAVGAAAVLVAAWPSIAKPASVEAYLQLSVSHCRAGLHLLQPLNLGTQRLQVQVGSLTTRTNLLHKGNTTSRLLCPDGAHPSSQRPIPQGADPWLMIKALAALRRRHSPLTATEMHCPCP